MRMPIPLRTLLCMLAALLPAAAQPPSVGAVVNAASNLPPGLPHAAVGRGALFIIYGAGLGPGSLEKASAFPLPLTLAGTSITISAGGQTIAAPVYYTLASQVAAILPSATPVGAGTVTVTYNGQASRPAPIAIVESNPGLFTVNSQGTGEAVATFPDYRYLTAGAAANPGEAIILWATGLGPIATDDRQPPQSVDMTSVPLEVFIGGKPAAILYRGRNSCCSGLDQINVTIPAGVAGCNTPVVLKVGNLVSNTTSIPVTASGRACPNTLYQELLRKPAVSLGAITLLRNTITVAGTGGALSTTRTDAGSGIFYRINSQNAYALAATADLPSSGSCSVTASPSQSASQLLGVSTSGLDAGPQLTLTGPSGNRTLGKSQSPATTIYLGQFGDTTPGNFFDAGEYTMRGSGGTDVGPFTARVTAGPPLVWTNQAASVSVERSRGVTLTWTGGDPNGNVYITGGGTVATSGSTFVSVRFDCNAPTRDGSFTLPPHVLLALPAVSDGTLTVGSFTAGTPFTAQGLDFGRILYGVNSLNLGIVAYR